MPTTSRPSSSEVDVALPTRGLSPGSPAGDATLAVPSAEPAGPGGAPVRAVESRGSVPDAGSRGAVLSAAALPPGPFGRYRIERLLGRGAMGAVYLAHDTELQRFVALKVPLFDDQTTPAQVERFFREARSAAVLNHPGICPVYDVGEHAGIRFLAMAYIEGRPLSDYVQPGRLQPERHVALVVRKLALALQAAHDKGIVHRDLKPGNVMIDARSEPIVMDFGLALRFDDASQATLTQEGTVVGTPAYMAPEQLSSRRELGPACDIWALGVILYELLTGLRPFQGPVVTLIAGILHEEPRPVTELRADISPALAEICRKALAKDPAQRFASMNDFALALADFLKGQTAASAPPATQPPTAPPRAPEASRSATPTRTVRQSPPTRAVAASSSDDTAWDDDLLAEAAALPPVARRSKPRESKAKASSGGDRNILWFALGGIASTVVVLGIVLAFTWGRTPRASEESPAEGRPPHEPVALAGGGSAPLGGTGAPPDNDSPTSDPAPPTRPSTNTQPETPAAPTGSPPTGPAVEPPRGSGVPIVSNPPPDTPGPNKTPDAPPSPTDAPASSPTGSAPVQPPSTSGTTPRFGGPGNGVPPTDGQRNFADLSAEEHFANHDRNGDGSLFPTEIPPHIIERCDVNNDRRLSRTEFRKGFEKFGTKLFDPPAGPGIGSGPSNIPRLPQPVGPQRPRRPD